MPIRNVLVDIEGTTTPVTFVHEILFPYAQRNLRAYVERNRTAAPVDACLVATKATVQAEQGLSLSDGQAVDQLLLWIDEDRKHTALKELQGYIWQAGYEAGAFQGQVYADVEPNLRQWRAAGVTLGVYSSGSVAAQKLLFGYSEVGDLTELFSYFFDTHIGGKKEADSYRRIVQKMECEPPACLFLSDLEAELDAAQAAGLSTIQVVRPGTTASQRHRTAWSFDAITVLL